MILLITLVILVILSTLGYTLCVQVAARRHRDQYVIDYSIARHACASGSEVRAGLGGQPPVRLWSAGPTSRISPTSSP